MTETQILQWFKTTIGSIVRQAVEDSPNCIYTEELLIGMAMRETGLKVMKLLNAELHAPQLFNQVKGDFGKRPGDKVDCFHGFGFWQIDIKSFPAFIASGDWQDPYKCCIMAIKILNDKRDYLLKKFPHLGDNPEMFLMEIVASYNCGQGAESMAIHLQKDVDARTFNNDYANEVFRFKDMYKLAMAA